MNSLHKNQQRILDYLLDHLEGATLEELSAHLGVTKTAAKEHVIKLDGLGCLTYFDTKGAVGRPRRKYLLSPDGHEKFPRQYSWLSTNLLELLAQEFGTDGLAKKMKELGTKVSGDMRARFEKTKSTAELFAEVTKALNELGYRSVLKQSDVRKGAVIEATNCVYHEVAKKNPGLCQFDIQFIKSATNMDVKLESCIARGGSVCRFCIRNK